ncbi:NAD(P)H-binding protein [soil metagenome]
MDDVLVLGATGTTGSRVAAFLDQRHVPVRRATRSPASPGQVRFDWNDSGTHKRALHGVSAVYLVAPVGAVDPAHAVEPFLRQALELGVRRVVQLSSSALPEGAPGLGAVHHLVRSMMPEWAVLRPSWFMQNFTGEHLVAQGIRDGVIVTATGAGRVAFIDADDIAAVAGHALTEAVPHNTDHILTGPQALSYTDAADIVARQVGHPVRHRPVSVDDYAAHLAAGGIPADFATVLAALDADIACGAEDRVTTDVEDITGRPPRTFEEFCARSVR